MDGPHFVYPSSIDGHLGCFRLLAVVSSAAVNTCVQVSVSVPVFNSFGIYLGVELLGHMVVL